MNTKAPTPECQFAMDEEQDSVLDRWEPPFLPSDDDAGEHQAVTLQEEAEGQRSTVGEEHDDQDSQGFPDDSQVIPDNSQVVPDDSHGFPDDSQGMSDESDCDAFRLNAELLDIHNNADGKTKSEEHDKDTGSLATTVPLGPAWEDGVPFPEGYAGYVHPETSKPEPSKEATHIAKAQKELKTPAPCQENQTKSWG
eukprot:s2692_g8.t1